MDTRSDLTARRWTIEFAAVALIATALSTGWRTDGMPNQGAPAPGEIKRGVELTGVVRSEPLATRIDSAFASRIEHVEVQEGRAVKAGDPLIRLDTEPQLADIEALRMQLGLLYVQKAAAAAEQDGARTLTISPLELADLSATPGATAAIADLIVAQEETLTQRATLTQLRRDSAANQKTRLAKKRALQSLIRGKSIEQLKSAAAERDRITGMVSRGTFPLNRAAEVERAVLAAELKIAETDSAIADIDGEMESLAITSAEAVRDRWDELFNREQEVTLKIAELKRRIETSQRQLENAVVRAPHDGVVRNVRFALAGTYVANGEHLLDIAKPDQTFLVEAVAGTNEIAAVSAGGGAKIRIASAAGGNTLTSIPALVEGLEQEDDATAGDGGTRRLFFTVEEGDVPGSLRQKLRPGYMVSIELDATAVRPVRDTPADATPGAPAAALRGPHPRASARETGTLNSG